MKNIREIDDTEKELINIEKSRIKDEHSFSSKTFFTIISIVIGGIFLYFRNSCPIVKEPFVAFIFFGILLFVIQVWGTTSDLKWSYHNLMKNIITSKKLEDYLPKKKSWYQRILFGFSVGYFTFLILFILTKSVKISLIVGFIIGVIFIISPRHF